MPKIPNINMTPATPPVILRLENITLTGVIGIIGLITPKKNNTIPHCIVASQITIE